MRIPFDSLDSTTWMAFSDWSAEQGKEKAAKYAGRVGKALEKFHTNKQKVNLTLVTSGVSPIHKGSLRVDSTGHLLCYIGWSDSGHPLNTRVDPNTCLWKPWICSELFVNSPNDLPDPWKWSRLSRKFFSAVADQSVRLKL